MKEGTCVGAGVEGPDSSSPSFSCSPSTPSPTLAIIQAHSMQTMSLWIPSFHFCVSFLLSLCPQYDRPLRVLFELLFLAYAYPFLDVYPPTFVSNSFPSPLLTSRVPLTTSIRYLSPTHVPQCSPLYRHPSPLLSQSKEKKWPCLCCRVVLFSFVIYKCIDLSTFTNCGSRHQMHQN